MYDEMLKKLNQNIKCELSIDELKLFYEIDVTCPMDLTVLRFRRSGYYKDFCKMFGEDKVVLFNQNLIDENTVAFVGALELFEKLPTYNLRYICGSLYHNYNKLENLENLEIVYDKLILNGEYNDYDGICNLSSVYGKVEITYDKKCNYFIPENVKSLYIYNMFDMKYFINHKLPNNINTLVMPDLVDTNDYIFPEGMKMIEFKNVDTIKSEQLPQSLTGLSLGTKHFENIKNMKFSKYLQYLVMNEMIELNDFILPPNLEDAVFENLRKVSGLVCPDTLLELCMKNTEEIKSVKIPSSLKKLEIGYKANLTDVILPEKIEIILLYDYNQAMNMYSEPGYVDLEKLIEYKECKLPKIFIDLYNCGLRYFRSLTIPTSFIKFLNKDDITYLRSISNVNEKVKKIK